MSIEIKVPVLPESVADATVAQWHKKPGDSIKRDENLVDLETDKVMLAVPAPHDGVLEKVLKAEGSVVKANDVLAVLNETAAGAKPAEAAAKPAAEKKPEEKKVEEKKTEEKKEEKKPQPSELGPSARRAASERELDTSKIQGSGKGGRVTREDVEKHPTAPRAEAPVAPEMLGERPEKRVPMSRLRARIAERLVEVQHAAAMLTTFNEVNMQPIMDIRARYKDQFEKTYGVRLGLMSFFVKASIEALRRFPIVNSSIDGHDIVYHGYYDIGIAVSTPRGLVVPVIRDADSLSIAGIEKAIGEYAEKARDGKLTIEEMTGGTFTITNGGVFGSMLSTPIINAPQCAILGMHNIVKRAVVENDQIVIRPIMYLALSYDHRLIDGRDSVSFLVTIKQLLEDPARLLLEL